MPRLATKEDVAPIVLLVNAAYQGEPGVASWTNEADIVLGPRITAREIEERIASPDGVILVVPDANEEPACSLAGCVHVERRGDSCYIGLLSVHPRAQSARLGTQLLHAAEEHARESFGSAVAAVWVVNARTELVAWYERKGYARTGETHPFPPAEARVPGLEFLVLRKMLL
jgi:GNAT superfamily N-acetyltransferase